MTNPPSKEQVRAALEATLALGDAIRELGEVPSGHLYARSGVTLQQYQSMLGVLTRTGLVEEDARHMLRWIGPKKVVA